MENRESLSLFIRNAGPDSNLTNLYLHSKLPIKHFTNWDGGLTSLEKTNIDNVQGFGAHSYLNIRNKVSDIRAIDDIAFISYGEYTDINKSITNITTTGKIFYYIKTNVFYDSVQTEYRTDGRIYLPDLNLNGLAYDYDLAPPNAYESFPSVNYDISNLFLRIKYKSIDYNGVDFYVPVSGINFSQLVNRYQFMGPDNLLIGQDAYYTNDPYNDKYNFLSFLPSLTLPKTGDLIYDGSSEIANGYSEYYMDVELEISLIKYTPVYNCGKIDIVKTKSGTCLQITTPYLISNNHKLVDGDIIQITGSSYEHINGIKYVQIANSNQFVIYEDDKFTKRTDISGLSSINLRWSCIGNIYGGDLGRWQYIKSVFSPNGRNRYGSYTVNNNVVNLTTTSFTSGNLIRSEFNNINSYNGIFEIDYNVGIQDAQVPPYTGRHNDNEINNVDINRGLIQVRQGMSSALDDWRMGGNSYLTNFRFGCSIDVKKYNNKYYLLAGERGPQTCLHLDKINLPVKPLNGSSYLFEIDSNLNLTLLDTFDASKNDPEISDCPLSCSPYYGPEKLFIYQPDSMDDIIDGVRGNYTRMIEYKDGFEYWYGSMCLHMYDPWNNFSDNIPGYFNYSVLDASIADSFLAYNVNSVRTKYFAGAAITYGINRFIAYNFNYFEFFYSVPRYKYNFIYPSQYFPWSKLSYYPYVDSFGKSVALDIIGGDFIVACSSKTKPYVIRPEANLLTVEPNIDPATNYTGTDNQIASTSSGYIHIFKNGTKIQKIHEDGIKTPGKLFDSQSERGEKFAKTLLCDGGQLIFGFSQPFDNQLFENEKSKIFFYTYNGLSYIKSGVIENRNNRDISIFNPLKISLPDHKAYWLTGIDNRQKSLSSLDVYYQPSDNFGDSFIYDGGLLICNGYDVENEFSEINSQQTLITIDADLNEYFRSLNYIDQLFIYENYEYRGRILPTLNITDPNYSLISLTSLYNDSIRTFHTNSNLRVLDILLSGRYSLYGDRLIFRDPLSLNIFNKTASLKLNESFIKSFNKKVIPLPNSTSNKFEQLNNAINILKPQIGAINNDRGGIINGTYSDALNILSVNDNAYSYDIHDLNSVNLFIKNDNDTPSIDLYIKTLEFSTNNIPLDITGSNPGNMNIYILGDDYKPNANNESLFIEGSISNSLGADLFMNNDTFGISPLYIESDLPISNNLQSNLFIYGSTINSIINNSDASLVINGTQYLSDSNSLLLVISGDKLSLENSTPLYMNNVVYNESQNINIVINGSISGNIYNDQTSTLFIKNQIGNDNSMDLFIRQVGLVGEPIVDSSNLFIQNQSIDSGISIFTKSANLQDLGINIVIDGTSVQDRNMNTFIRGYIE